MKFIFPIFLFMVYTDAQDFRPNVYVQCIDGVLAVTVSTDDPFNGVIYAEGHRDTCSQKGTGLHRSSLLIPLTGFHECGIVYRHWEEQYYVLVNVRQHAMIILQQDRTFNVSCPKDGGIERRNDSDPASIQMGLFAQDQFMHMGVFGQPYQLKVWAAANDKFTVSTCMGFAGTNQSIQLTDEIGCTVNSDLVGNFDYDDAVNSATAPIQSMFKFPFFNVLHIQCAVWFCNDKCKRVDCERRRSLERIGSSVTQHGYHAEKRDGGMKRRYASTTISVAEVGGVTRELYQSTCPYHTQLMAALCILFAALFVGALIINLAFCALGGYCCCQDDSTASISTMEYMHSDSKSMPSKLHHVTPPPFTIYDAQSQSKSVGTCYGYTNAIDPSALIGQHSHSPTNSFLSEISHHGGIDRRPLIKVVDADRPWHETDTRTRHMDRHETEARHMDRQRRVQLAGQRHSADPLHVITTQGTAF